MARWTCAIGAKLANPYLSTERARLCVLMCSILPGLKILRDLAGEKYFKLQLLRVELKRPAGLNLFQCVRRFARPYACGISGIQCPKMPQFTNRRMRTFIATPSARKVNNTEDPP
jgi:hypothetical protein